MLKKNARQNVEDSCSSLKQVKQYLNDAATTVENHSTKCKIENQLHSIEQCLSECEVIVNKLREK